MTTRLFSVVFDAGDPARLGRWWAEALDWPVTFESPDEVVVEPADNEATEAMPALVFVPVSDPKVGKNRVHLDLASDSSDHQRAQVERLVGLGATHVDIGQRDVPWVVLADPEGNELCVLEPRDRYRARGPLAAIVVDAVEPDTLARFWTEATGWPIGSRSEMVVSLFRPGDLLPDLDFGRTAVPKTVKNRIHLDVAPFAGDDHDADVERLIAFGASPVDVGQGADVSWVVLADPEGNEFCVLRPR
jgi:predicted enzyme related to lactoylglutathione lyase